MSAIAQFLRQFRPAFLGGTQIAREKTPLPGEIVAGGSERGFRPNPQDQIARIYQNMHVDLRLAAAIHDIRLMDAKDGRVKKIHRMTSRSAAKGGLQLRAVGQSKELFKEWEVFWRRLGLDRTEKLQSDLRGVLMEGNLPMQWVLDAEANVAACVRMPTDTLVPRVGQNGQFLDVRRAYDQMQVGFGQQVVASFALWQLTVARLDPNNYDDWGAMGRPYLDASRETWQKLRMSEESLVVRREMRAPLRMAHTLEGATEDELKTYKAQVELDQASGNYTDYYLNKKGAVTALQGDANLDQIADIAHLLDTFYAGSPAPKGLFGYVGDLNRDILEDLKKDYFEEVDAIQDVVAFVYDVGFRLHLLLRGKNPNAHDFYVRFAERRTETPNQLADLALKYQALGVPPDLLMDAAGLDIKEVREALAKHNADSSPYPNLEDDSGATNTAGRPNVSITPSNAPKGESATNISNARKV